MNKSVIVSSIGLATPEIAKILSDSFQMDHQYVLKQIYNAPSILFHDIEDTLAAKVYELLTNVGMEVELMDAPGSIPEPKDPIDIAIHLEDPLLLPIVSQELSQFIGCSPAEALNLLIEEPGVVLGNVSEATAAALQKRTSGKVIILKPKEDLYIIELKNLDSIQIRQMESFLKAKGISTKLTSNAVVENVSYTVSQEFWRKFQSQKEFKIYSQNLQRFEVVWTDTNVTLDYKTILHERTSMPLESIDEIQMHLPVQLHESIDYRSMLELKEAYTENGIVTDIKAIASGNKTIHINTVSDPNLASKILKQFYPETELPVKNGKWVAPRSLPSELARYASAALEEIGCDTEVC